MFRAEIQWLATGPTLRFEGRLVADWAEQARHLVTRDVLPEGLTVDLTELSYIDSAGEQLLKWLARMGVKFIAGNIYTMGVCERLHLPTLERTSFRHKRPYAGPQLSRSHNISTPATTFHDAERTVIREALEAASGQISGNGGAAERLGLKLTTLQNKMRRLGISRREYRSQP